MKQIKIKEPVFRTTLQIVYDCTLKKCYEKFNIEGYEEFPTIGEYIPVEEGRSNIIWVEDITNISVIIHELNHFIFYVLSNYKLIPHTSDTDEVYSYMIEYYFSKISLNK